MIKCQSCQRKYEPGEWDNSAFWCRDCSEGMDEMEAIESGEIVLDYTQNGNGDGIIAYDYRHAGESD